MSRVVVRQAGLEDMAALLRLERGAATAPHWAEVEYEAILGHADSEGMLRRCIFVAELEGRMAGFAVGKVVASVGELESVVVDAAARRMGLGRALCEAVIAWCRGLNATELELEVRAGSDGAIALYRGLGFEEVGRRRGYYREPVEDALLMRLRLGSDG